MTDESAEVKLYLDHVLVVVKEATEEVLKALAFRITERAQLNIRSNDQVDTGFMVNSIYPVWKDGSDYGQAKASAESHTHSSKTGREVDHSGDMAPPEILPASASAAVVVGANYAIYQENINPFFYPAAQRAAAEFDAEATAIYRERMPKEDSRV
jgi:hypothetical protein